MMLLLLLLLLCLHLDCCVLLDISCGAVGGVGLSSGCRQNQAHGRRVDLSDGTELAIAADNELLAIGSGGSGSGRDELFVLRRGSSDHHGALGSGSQNAGGAARADVLQLQQSRSFGSHDQARGQDQLLANEIHWLDDLAVLQEDLLGLGLGGGGCFVDDDALDARAELELLRELRGVGRWLGCYLDHLLLVMLLLLLVVVLCLMVLLLMVLLLSCRRCMLQVA